MKVKFKYFLSILFLILFFVLAYFVKKDGTYFIDEWIYNLMMKSFSNFGTNVYKFFTFFASVRFVLLTLLVVLFFRNKNYIYIYFSNVGITVLLNQIFKLIFSRTRPEKLMLVLEKGYSFPSGHVMCATSIYGLIIYFILKSNFDKGLKALLVIICVLLIISICMSRIYLGVHYATDVLGGLLLSTSYILIFTNVIGSDKFGTKFGK